MFNFRIKHDYYEIGTKKPVYSVLRYLDGFPYQIGDIIRNKIFDKNIYYIGEYFNVN